MDAEFWQKRWQNTEIGFHALQHHAALLGGYARGQWKTPPQVLVPLCGKSLDLCWLREQGCRVVGVELSPIAVEDFFKSQGLIPTVNNHDGHRVYTAEDYEILCGDFFKLPNTWFAQFDFVYDRAALVALPPTMRTSYAKQLILSLAPHAQMLLIGFEYPQIQMAGPPFAVEREEIERLYGERFHIELLTQNNLLETEPRWRERELTRLVETSYWLSPKQKIAPAFSAYTPSLALTVLVRMALS